MRSRIRGCQIVLEINVQNGLISLGVTRLYNILNITACEIKTALNHHCSRGANTLKVENWPFKKKKTIHRLYKNNIFAKPNMLRFVNMILVPQFRRCFWSLQPRGPGSLRCSSASWECAWIQRTTARRAAVLHSHNVSLPPAVAPEGENNTRVRRCDFKQDLDPPIQLHGK